MEAVLPGVVATNGRQRMDTDMEYKQYIIGKFSRAPDRLSDGGEAPATTARRGDGGR